MEERVAITTGCMRPICTLNQTKNVRTTLLQAKPGNTYAHHAHARPNMPPKRKLKGRLTDNNSPLAQ